MREESVARRYAAALFEQAHKADTVTQSGEELALAARIVAETGALRALLGQPAAWSVPASLATMVVVSRLTRATVPSHAGRFMVRLHTPESVGVDRG
jgi:cation/acetate symporter